MPSGLVLALGLAALLAIGGPAAAASLVDGGFESGTLAGPYAIAPLPMSVGFWTRGTDDSHLVAPPGRVHSGQWALEVDTRNHPHGSAVYQDFDSATLSYVWTIWVFPSEGANVAELIYNWDRGTLGHAEVGTLFWFRPTETKFNGWNGNATFPAVPAGGWHEILVRADRCTREQEIRLDGALWGTVKAVTPPPAGNATVILGDVAFNALQGLYGYDDVAFELFDCSTPGKAPCPRSFGFWKTHPEAWTVASLTLGDETYSKPELVRILKMPSRGDASLILARQLVGAKLNIANGSDPGPIRKAIADADALLAPFAGMLPYHVRPSSGPGRTMITLAAVLEKYNEGELTPNCHPCSDEEHGNHDGDHEHEDRCDDRDEDHDQVRGCDQAWRASEGDGGVRSHRDPDGKERQADRLRSGCDKPSPPDPTSVGSTPGLLSLLGLFGGASIVARARRPYCYPS